MRPISNVIATWTSSSTPYTGIGLNVYATSYSSDSRTLDIRVNGNRIFSIDTSGSITSNTITSLFSIANSSYNFANTLAIAAGDASFAFNQANLAFGKANSSYTTTNISYTTANAAYANANASVKLVSPTQTIYGEINVSGNIVTTNTTSSISSRQVKSNFYTPKDISFVSQGGYNTLFMLVDGKLYSCHGTQGSFSAWQAGRAEGNGYQADWGFEGLRRVMFPYETTSKITQADFSGCYCAYALFNNGNLYTWGYNNYGTCGLGDTSIRYTPVLAATGVTNVYSTGELTAQSGYTASRLYIKKTDGYIYCAGQNGYGQFGLGDTTNRSSFTQLPALGTDVQYVWNVGADYGSTYVVKNTGQILVAGYNGYGTYGNGGTSTSYSWVDITSYFNPSSLAVTKIFGQWGNYNTIGILLANGDLYTCGYGGYYETGDGNGTRYSPYKVLTGVTNAWCIGGGSAAATFFAAQGNNLYAWGYNGYGQCGNGGTSNLTTPTLVLSGTFSQFMNEGSLDNTTSYANYTQAIVKKTDGNLYATGWGGYGEIGNSYATNTNAGWQRILLPGDFNAVKVGAYCTTGTTREYIAIGDDNRMYAWGYNGQYGVHNNNNGQPITVPMQILARLGG